MDFPSSLPPPSYVRMSGSCPLPRPFLPCTMHGMCDAARGGNMTAELWVVASAVQVGEAIARGRVDASARHDLGPDFAATYASFSGKNIPGYWNNYLTWMLVQTLALRRWPEMGYSLRDAAALILRFLNEPTEAAPRNGPLAFWRNRPRPIGEAVPQVRATMRLLATLSGAAAEARAAALSPNADPTYTEEGALYFSDDERQAVLASLPALRAFLIEPPHGSRFHFWVVRQPGIPRAVREALVTPTRFLGDVEAVFSYARDAKAHVFVLWAP